MMPRPAPLFALAPLAAFAALLTGCWSGSTPLMPASARDAVPVAGEYVLAENADPHGNSATVTPITSLRARVQGNLLRIEPLGPKDPDVKPRTVSFDALEPDLYLAQVTFDEAGSRIDYYIVGVKDAGAEVIVLVPPCDEPQRKLGGKPGELDSTICHWSSYAALRQAAQDLVKRDPGSAGIRQVLLYKRK